MLLAGTVAGGSLAQTLCRILVAVALGVVGFALLGTTRQGVATWTASMAGAAASGAEIVRAVVMLLAGLVVLFLTWPPRQRLQGRPGAYADLFGGADDQGKAGWRLGVVSALVQTGVLDVAAVQQVKGMGSTLLLRACLAVLRVVRGSGQVPAARGLAARSLLLAGYHCVVAPVAALLPWSPHRPWCRCDDGVSPARGTKSPGCPGPAGGRPGQSGADDHPCEEVVDSGSPGLRGLPPARFRLPGGGRSRGHGGGDGPNLHGEAPFGATRAGAEAARVSDTSACTSGSKGGRTGGCSSTSNTSTRGEIGLWPGCWGVRSSAAGRAEGG